MRNINLKCGILLVFCVGLTKIQAQTIKDVDGNTYNVLTIGTQTWIKEDLKVMHYQNGDLINTKTDTAYICYETNPKYQWAYDGKEDLAKEKGRLYTYNVVTDERKVCPVGWHVPGIQEWLVLKKYLGVDTISIGKNGSFNSDLISSIANKKGFIYQSGVIRKCNGEYLKLFFGCWWSSSKDGNRSAIIDFLPLQIMSKDIDEDKRGLPIRCIKD